VARRGHRWKNRTQAQALWHMRESIPAGARQEPVMVYRHDIAVASAGSPTSSAKRRRRSKRASERRLICSATSATATCTKTLPA